MKSVRSSRQVRALLHLTLCAGVAALAACASPVSHFYTLGAGGMTQSPAASTNSTAPATSTAPTTSAPSAPPAAPASQRAAGPAFLIEVPPVDVPSQVARNQLVVQTGGARVDVLEQERWASPPADEIRRALSGDLAARLGTFDVYGAPYPNGVPVYRIGVNVRRFESWPDSRAVLDAVWSVRTVGTQAVLTCRTLAQVPVGHGYAALVEGHRQAVAQVADEIAAAVRSFASGGAMPSAANGQCAADKQSSAKRSGAA
jgi:uncharacterized lipoprotein YmbA